MNTMNEKLDAIERVLELCLNGNKYTKLLTLVCFCSYVGVRSVYMLKDEL